MKKILITGGSGGMGRVCAEMAAAEGYELILADLASSNLTAVTDNLTARGVKATSLTLDVTSPDSIAALAAALKSAGGVDAIIHTVGVSPNMADWQRIVKVDLTGAALTLEALRPVLKSGGGAVCISSMSGYMCPPDEAVERVLADPVATDLLDRIAALPGHPLQNSGLAYSYAKKALQVHVAAIARQWGQEGKRIVSISPGMIDTEQGQLEYRKMTDFNAMQARIALGRLGKPSDIAATALFLVSEQAAYITGCDILVDGGFVASLRSNSK